MSSRHFHVKKVKKHASLAVLQCLQEIVSLSGTICTGTRQGDLMCFCEVAKIMRKFSFGGLLVPLEMFGTRQRFLFTIIMHMR